MRKQFALKNYKGEIFSYVFGNDFPEMIEKITENLNLIFLGYGDIANGSCLSGYIFRDCNNNRFILETSFIYIVE